MDTLGISVVVVVRDGASTIHRALCSIFENTLHPQEVLVVDGQSEDNTIDISRQFPVRIIRNPRRKIAPGRNIGLNAAQGELIAFTDADCVVERSWLERIATNFQDNAHLAGVGGKIVALPPRSEIEAFAGDVFLNRIMRYGDKPYRLNEMKVPGAIITANCAYRRSVLSEIGGFDEWFGNVAEDIDLFWRVLKADYELRYDPSLLVYHSFPQDLRKFCGKQFGFGYASSRLTKRHQKGTVVDWHLYRELWNSALKIAVARSQRRKSALSCVQLLCHLAGKYYGSIICRCINL